MHDYLGAVGFKSIKNNREYQKLIQTVMDTPTMEFISDNGRELPQGEKSREFADSMGITVRGEYDEDGVFQFSYAFPYFKGSQVTTKDDIFIEKHVDRESYAGVCDDVKVGVSLIFHMLNMVDYIDHYEYNKEHHLIAPAILSGLSIEGKVILPIKNMKSLDKKSKAENSNRNQMIAAARQGDQDAIESLTLEDIDMYTSITKRAVKEDILSIVDSYFMPYGISCDQYSILGTILDVKIVTNQVTDEDIYILCLNCNDLLFDICINKQDLLGEPLPGRRFRGSIWMQGSIDFSPGA